LSTATIRREEDDGARRIGGGERPGHDGRTEERERSQEGKSTEHQARLKS
jgi:hypothetical protein